MHLDLATRTDLRSLLDLLDNADRQGAPSATITAIMKLESSYGSGFDERLKLALAPEALAKVCQVLKYEEARFASKASELLGYNRQLSDAAHRDIDELQCAAAKVESMRLKLR